MNTQKIVGFVALVVICGFGLLTVMIRESGPDTISREIAEKLIFAEREGVVYYENDSPRSWNAVVVWPKGETLQVSYIDQPIIDKDETMQWREMSYIFSFPDGRQVAVGDADMDGQVDYLSVNGAAVFHTEPGYQDVNPELRPEAQQVLEKFRVAALALARAPDGDLRDYVTPPGVPL